MSPGSEVRKACFHQDLDRKGREGGRGRERERERERERMTFVQEHMVLSSHWSRHVLSLHQPHLDFLQHTNTHNKTINSQVTCHMMYSPGNSEEDDEGGRGCSPFSSGGSFPPANCLNLDMTSPPYTSHVSTCKLQKHVRHPHPLTLL